MLPSRYLLTSNNRLNVGSTLMMLLLPSEEQSICPGVDSRRRSTETRGGSCIIICRPTRMETFIAFDFGSTRRPHGAFESVKAHTHAHTPANRLNKPGEERGSGGGRGMSVCLICCCMNDAAVFQVIVGGLKTGVCLKNNINIIAVTRLSVLMSTSSALLCRSRLF